MTVLLAVGDCFSAFLLEPVLAELRRRGVAFRVAAAASAGEVNALRRVLGEHVTTRPIAHPGEAIAFAQELVELETACVVTVGSSDCASSFAEVAAKRRVRTVHLDGGVRAFGGPVRGERAAHAHCVTGDLERLCLVQDGVAAESITMVGDLLATAVAGVVAGGSPACGGLAVACEHVGPSTAFDFFEELFAPAGWPRLPRPARDAEVAAWIAYVAAARVVLTDSVGWQRVAVALGVPCMAFARWGLWAPGVAAGLVTGTDVPHEAPAAVAQRLAQMPRTAPTPPVGVAAQIADVVLAGTPPAATALPSDGDASGRTFSNDEAALVAMVLQRGTLNSTRGTMVTAFEKRFAQWLGRKHAIACASGSAAVHCAIAALRLQPGDEVITTPITDMGAITPILYEGAVPVFADVDHVTLNVTVDAVKAQLTDRTRAIVVTHLFGCPCDLDGLQALAKERGVALIEDAAQAFGATWRGKKVGAFGALGTFSLQQGKHITTGEGGIVATDDDELARRVFLFVNKAWGYGDQKPDHYFPALNYRLTELQGAVALAQLPKLDGVVAARRQVAAALQQALADVPGLTLPHDPAHGAHSWWKFAFHVDSGRVPGGPRALAQKLQAAGIACAPHYIQKPAFACELFRDWRASPVTWLPLQHNPRRERAASMFDRSAYPGALGGLDSVVVLPINERYTQAHVEHVANAIRAAVGALQHA